MIFNHKTTISGRPTLKFFVCLKKKKNCKKRYGF